MTPLFSIILPTHNRPDTFLRAVSSVIHQNFRDFELVVIDDASPTNYAQAICGTLNIPYRLIKNPVTLGAAGSRNVGIEAARGKYISLLDDDDEYERTFLSSTYECLLATPDEVGVSWCGANRIIYPINSDEFFVYVILNFPISYSSQTALFEKFISIGTGHGITIKRKCIDVVGLFDSQFKVVEDTDFFIRILENGFCPVVVPGVHITLHDHKNQKLSNASLHPIRVTECHRLLSRHAEFFKEFPLFQSNMENHIKSLEGQMEPKAP
jgi:glycosyltransferase involved in cell wall biosynthesis